MVESEKLYEEIKRFFYEKDEYDFVIEISDRPMNEWKLHFVFSLDEMRRVRYPMMNLGVEFAGFFTTKDNTATIFQIKISSSLKICEQVRLYILKTKHSVNLI